MPYDECQVRRPAEQDECRKNKEQWREKNELERREKGEDNDGQIEISTK